MGAVFPILALAAGYAIFTWPLVRNAQRFMPKWAAIAFVDAGLALVGAAAAYASAAPIYEQAQAAVALLARVGGGMFAAFDVNLAAYAGEALRAAAGLVRSAAALTAVLLLVPVLAAYFQLDAPRYERALLTVLPERHHAAALATMQEISRVVGRFVRGQVCISAVVAVLVYAVLRLTHVPYAGIIALVTGCLDLVPYLGGVAAFVPSLLFALHSGGVAHAVLVGVLLAAVFEFEAQVLAPQILGSNTGLPPSVIVIALLAGSSLFGVLGLYVAVPATAAGAVIVRAVLSRDRSSSPLLPAASVRSGHAHHRR